MMIPFDSARGAVGPMRALKGASLRKPFGIAMARSRVSRFWLATANAIASASFDLSRPTAGGSALGHAPRAGKAARGAGARRAETRTVTARHAATETIALAVGEVRLISIRSRLLGSDLGQTATVLMRTHCNSVTPGTRSTSAGRSLPLRIEFA